MYKTYMFDLLRNERLACHFLFKEVKLKKLFIIDSRKSENIKQRKVFHQNYYLFKY